MGNAFHTLVSNGRGAVRREFPGGREHLVVPMTMIVPGVLPGSKGPLYYSPQELARTAAAWEGVPVVARSHPTENGRPVSAADPGVLARQGIGVVRNPRIRAGDGALVAEAWLNVRDAAAKWPEMLDVVRAGRPVELSTGLFTRDTPVRNGRCPRTGRPYSATVRVEKPDHLAVLENEPGACSLKDGCGLGVNAAKKTGKGSKLTGGRWVTTSDGNKLYIRDGKPVAGNPHVIKAAGGPGKKAGGTEKKMEAAGEKKSDTPPGDKKNVSPEGSKTEALPAKGSEPDKPAGYVRNPLFDQKSATTPAQTANTSGAAKTNEKKAWYADHKDLDHTPLGKPGDKEGLSKAARDAVIGRGHLTDARRLTKTATKSLRLARRRLPTGNTILETTVPFDREKTVKYITANCDCWKGEDGKKALSGMTDDQVKAVRNGLVLETRVLNAYHEATGHTEVDRAALNEFVANSGKVAKPAAEKDDDACTKGKTKKKDATHNSTNPFSGLTDAQVFDMLPESIREVVANGKKLVDRSRKEMIGRLTANMGLTGEAAAKHAAKFARLTTDELEELAADLPAPTANRDNPFLPGSDVGDEDDPLATGGVHNRLARFGPASGDRVGPPVRNSAQADEDVFLDLPGGDEMHGEPAFNAAGRNGKARRTAELEY